ncbi:MAG: ATP-binding protein [Opitutus sp.]
MSDSLPGRPQAGRSPPSTTPPAVLLLDAGGRIIQANAAAHSLVGRRGGTLLGLNLSSLVIPDRPPESPGVNLADWFASRTQTSLTLSVRATAAADVVASAFSGLLTLERWSEDQVLATLPSDLAPATVRPPDHLDLDLIQEQGAVGFFELSALTGEAHFSPSWRTMLGYVDAALPETLEAWRGLLHPEDSAAAPDRLNKRATDSVRPFNVECRFRHRAGHWVWLQTVGVQLIDPSGTLERVVGLQIDISDRKDLEDAGINNEERLHFLSSAGPIGVFDLNFAASSYWFSPAWNRILGYAEDTGDNSLETFLAALPPDEQAAGAETWIRLRAPGQPSSLSTEHLVGAAGSRVPVLLGMHRSLSRKRDLARVVGFICSTPGTASSAVGDTVIETAFATLSEALLITNAAGKITHLNPAACRLLGVEAEAAIGGLGSDLFRLVARDTGQPAENPFSRALTATAPLPLINDSALPPRDASGAPRPIVWTGRACTDPDDRPAGVIIVFRDPAELRLTSEELIKANRWESLGAVAGGIAHDFNELLTTIIGGISLAKDHNDPSSLADSEHACNAAKGLTKQLLAFARGGAAAHAIITAEELLVTPVKLASAGSDVALSVEIAEGTAPVRVDRALMTQVFHNLILNALQAMPGPPHHGRVHLRATNTSLVADQIPPLPAGGYVELEVRDNASGIAAENLERIFDPFFTTRKHGTGLGLATALSIVRKHGGQIGVVSTPGEGTAMTVFLPRADEPEPTPNRAAPSSRFRTGRILVVDDDPKITAVTAAMLRTLDYKYDIAHEGAEAIQLYQRYFNISRPYDAVILDATIPGGMSGEECFRALRELDSDVRAIISTSYDNDAMARRFIELGFCGSLNKPFRTADLGKVLKTVLG